MIQTTSKLKNLIGLLVSYALYATLKKLNVDVCMKLNMVLCTMVNQYVLKNFVLYVDLHGDMKEDHGDNTKNICRKLFFYTFHFINLNIYDM